MNDLDCLIGQRFEALVRHEGYWIAKLDPGYTLNIGGLWRLIENGHIRFTSTDDGHQFGLPKPVDAEAEVNLHIVGARRVS